MALDTKYFSVVKWFYGIHTGKTLRSHTTYFQFLQEVPGFGNSPIGYIPREKSIPSPYAYSPTDFVYVWNGLRVIIRETAQRKYQAFEIPADIRVYNQEEDAIQAHVMKAAR